MTSLEMVKISLVSTESASTEATDRTLANDLESLPNDTAPVSLSHIQLEVAEVTEPPVRGQSEGWGGANHPDQSGTSEQWSENLWMTWNTEESPTKDNNLTCDTEELIWSEEIGCKYITLEVVAKKVDLQSPAKGCSWNFVLSGNN